MIKQLNQKFYLDSDVVSLSQKLLGKVVVTKFNNNLTAGMIVETEAYKAPEDKASHAYNHRRTPRTETMFEAGGVAYIYLCYGMHHLFNIVTGPKDVPHAILIRAIEPLEGVPTMLKRRNLGKVARNLTAGPALVSQALGLSYHQHNGLSLCSKELWLEDRGIKIPEDSIIASPRVGVDYAEEFKDTPWRFRIKDNVWTSLAK